MSIGLGIFLFVVGAILVFALDIQLDAIDIDMIGYILMGAGALIALIGFVMLMMRRNSVSSTRVTNDPATGDRVVRNETSRPTDPGEVA